MSTEHVHNVLFLCTGNSARSILCEAYLNARAPKRFRAFSAGSHPKAHVNPLTLETLHRSGLSTEGYRSKSWDEFAAPGAPEMDFVITVCDTAAGEVCPVWPGQPITAHWSFADPAAFEGSDRERRDLFLEIFRQIRSRLDIFRELPLARLDRLAIKRHVDDIGRTKADTPRLSRALAAEALGTLLLLAAVVGSGIMAERLTADVALMLLCNTLATGAALFVLIVVFAPLSGAHFNPAVSLVAFLQGKLAARSALAYAMAQIAGAVAGVWLAHAMFDVPIFALGIKSRAGEGQFLSEAVATFGLILTIAGLRDRSREAIAAAVALYIVAAYWFTASTSFANPAVTFARALTPTFAGIRPADAPAFIAAQFLGALCAWVVSRFLFAQASAKP